MHFDAELHSGRSLPTFHLAADGANGHVGEVVREPNRQVRAAIVHRAGQRTKTARADTKRAVSSKKYVENHILQTQGAHGSERVVI